LRFSVLNVSSPKVHIKVDTQANLDITTDLNFFGVVEAELRASDGTNSGSTAFQVVVENVNDKPEVELISPSDGAVIYNSTILLKWNGFDADTQDVSKLTYSVYLDTTSATTLYKTGLRESSIEISGLDDKSTYFWKVIASDGIENGSCISDPCPSKFSLDVRTLPTTTLLVPSNGALTNQDKIVLIWEKQSESGDVLTYNVYFSDNELNYPLPDSAVAASGINNNEWLISGLKADVTYYWTVIPSNLRGVGKCDSGIWSFEYDPNAAGYNIVIDVPQKLRLEQGKLHLIDIKINNKGDSSDIIVPFLEAGTAKFGVALEGIEQSHFIKKDSSIMLIMNVSSDKLPLGTYKLTLSMRSKGSGELTSTEITLEIYEKKEAVSDRDSVYYSVIPIIISLIILLIVFLYWQNKRIQEEKKMVDAEVLKPVHPSEMMATTDVKYIKGLEGRSLGSDDVDSTKLPVSTTMGEGGSEIRSLPPAKYLEEEGEKRLMVEESRGEPDKAVPEKKKKMKIIKQKGLTDQELLDMLEARFVKGDVSEDTYKELKQKYLERLEKSNDKSVPEELKEIKSKEESP
jgi:uncharacterized membrane protein